jgi:hypothetical protein
MSNKYKNQFTSSRIKTDFPARAGTGSGFIGSRALGILIRRQQKFREACALEIRKRGLITFFLTLYYP